MQWVEQNWLLVLLGAGVIFFMMRGGGMGCGMGRGMRGGGTGGSPHDHDQGSLPGGQGTMAAQAIDPVSGKTVNPATAVSTMYRGVPAYFESRENRDRFEASSGQFPVAPLSHHHRHGSC